MIHHVRLGDSVFALTTAQRSLLITARTAGGAMFVEGSRVRSARILESLGFAVLRDDGAPELHDGERWYFELSPIAMKSMGDV